MLILFQEGYMKIEGGHVSKGVLGVLQQAWCICSRTFVLISKGWQLDVGYFFLWLQHCLRAFCDIHLYKQFLKRLFQPGLLCALSRTGDVPKGGEEGQLLRCCCISPQTQHTHTHSLSRTEHSQCILAKSNKTHQDHVHPSESPLTLVCGCS